MSRDITLCHPRLQELANQLVAEAAKQGLKVKIGECFRSVAEQDALYAQGRTTSGSIVTNAKGSSYSSMHQWGVAFDIIRNDGKGAYNDSDGWFTKVAKIGKSLGLEWGGDWTSPVDKPHYQLPDWGSTPTKLKVTYGNVDNFKKTWEKEVTEVLTKQKMLINGASKTVEAINRDGYTYVKIRDLSDILTVGWDAENKVISVKSK